MSFMDFKDFPIFAVENSTFGDDLLKVCVCVCVYYYMYKYMYVQCGMPIENRKNTWESIALNDNRIEVWENEVWREY